MDNERILIIVDVQGFQYRSSDFLCKEIALFDFEKNEIQGYCTVTFPFENNFLDHKVQRYFDWLSNYIYGLLFTSSGSDAHINEIPYSDLYSWLQKNIKDYGLLLLKRVSKTTWFRNFLSFGTIVEDLLSQKEVVNLEHWSSPKCSTLRGIF